MVFGDLFSAQMTIPIHQLPQHFCFGIPFHLNIHEHELEQAFGKLTKGVNMYAPLIWANRSAQTNTNHL